MPSNDLKPKIHAALEKLSFDKPVDMRTSDLWVDLSKSRGEYDFRKGLFSLDIDKDNPPSLHKNSLSLLGGHIGSGKSTELTRIADYFHSPDKYCVISLDCLQDLDFTNMRFSDLLLGCANKVLETLERENVKLDGKHLKGLENWFKEKIISHEKLNEITGQIETEVSAGANFWVAKMLAKITTHISNTNKYREEIRDVVQSSFKEFAGLFNRMVEEATKQLRLQNKGLLFLMLVDGTDRLKSDDAKKFFVDDIHLLKLINLNFVFTINVDNFARSTHFNQWMNTVSLPMIKIFEKGSRELIPNNTACLKEMIAKRIDLGILEAETLVDEMILYSGGHPRDLMRLMIRAISETLGERKINADDVEKAKMLLAKDYSRLIRPEDFPVLKKIDQSPKDYVPQSEQVQRLLKDLVILEYNNYWWQTHPVVTLLPQYQNALSD